MKNKKIKVVLIVSIFMLGLFLQKFIDEKASITDVTDEQPDTNVVIETPGTLIQSYYDSYKDPFVIQIRTTLNSYLKDPKTLSDIILEGLGDGKSGLSSFSSDYYIGRFVVMDIKNAIAGGKEINILFPENPNKVFWVWIYKTSENVYEMRGFQQNSEYTKESIHYYIKQYPQLVNDIAHSL